MLSFMEYCLQVYFEKTNWQREHFYSNLTQASRDILEFTIPQGIGINLSRSSTDEFKVTYTSKYDNKIITSMGYLFTSKPLKLSPNTFIAYNQLMLERYYQQIENRLTSNHIHLENGELERLRLPLAKSDIEQDLKLSKQLEPSYVQSVLNWVHDKTLSTSDYLLYGNIFLPQGRLEGLYTCQLSSNSQCIISGVSAPKRPDQSHIAIMYQTATKNSNTELSYHTDTKLIGLRTLYRFYDFKNLLTDPKWSAGYEVYYSRATKLGGLSIGVRRESNLPTPTALTLTMNPVMGHLSTSYTNMIHPQLTAGTRYSFNFWSLESDLAAGFEWRNGREGLVKVSLGVNQGLTTLLSGRYRQLYFTLGILIDSPTNSLALKPKSHSLVKGIGIQLDYF